VGGAELFAESLKCRWVLVVAIDIAQQAAQLVERRGMESPVLLDAVTRSGLQLVEAPTGFRYPDDRHVKVTALRHRLQRWEYLLVGEIARRTEKDQRVRVGITHSLLLPRARC
jgi:hypothetical protein